MSVFNYSLSNRVSEHLPVLPLESRKNEITLRKDLDAPLTCEYNEQWFIAIRKICFSRDVCIDEKAFPFLQRRPLLEDGENFGSWENCSSFPETFVSSSLTPRSAYNYKQYLVPWHDVPLNAILALDSPDEIGRVGEEDKPNTELDKTFFQPLSIYLQENMEYDFSESFLLSCGFFHDAGDFLDNMLYCKRHSHSRFRLRPKADYRWKNSSLVDARQLMTNEIYIHCREAETPPITQQNLEEESVRWYQENLCTDQVIFHQAVRQTDYFKEPLFKLTAPHPIYYRLSGNTIESLNFSFCAAGGRRLRLARELNQANTLIDFQLVKMPADVYSQMVTLKGNNLLPNNTSAQFSVSLNDPIATEGALEDWEVALSSVTIPTSLESIWFEPHERNIVEFQHFKSDTGEVKQTLQFTVDKTHFRSNEELIMWMMEKFQPLEGLEVFILPLTAYHWGDGGPAIFALRKKSSPDEKYSAEEEDNNRFIFKFPAMLFSIMGGRVTKDTQFDRTTNTITLERNQNDVVNLFDQQVDAKLFQPTIGILCADFVKQALHLETMKPILSTFECELDENRNGFTFFPNPPIYMPISRMNISTMMFTLETIDGVHFPFSKGLNEPRIVLMFRKKAK